MAAPSSKRFMLSTPRPPRAGALSCLSPARPPGRSITGNRPARRPPAGEPSPSRGVPPPPGAIECVDRLLEPLLVLLVESPGLHRQPAHGLGDLVARPEQLVIDPLEVGPPGIAAQIAQRLFSRQDPFRARAETLLQRRAREPM